MDVQLFVAVNLMAFAAIALISSVIYWPLKAALSWIVVNGLVLAVGAAALEWQPSWAGVIVAAVFVPLVLGPMLLGHLATRANQRNQTSEAARYLRAASLLHPTPNARFSADLLAAQAHATTPEKLEALRVLAASASPARQALIRATSFRVKDDWQGLLDDIRKRPGPGTAATETGGPHDLKALEIRALGETGRIDEMARVFEASRNLIAATDLADCQLFVLAFGGRPVEVARLLERRGALDSDSRVYWRAVAARADDGADADWREPLDQLARTAANPALRQRAASRLAQPTQLARQQMTPAAVAVVDAVANRVRLAVPRPRPSWQGTPVTFALLALIAAGYLLEEASGGAEDLRTLVDLGALWPPYVWLKAEWWRLGSAMFLHYGPLHAGVNACMLWLLGRDAEAAFGSARMLLIYAVGGLASMGSVLWLMQAGIIQQAVLMGASGAIMAVFGGLVALKIMAWVRSRDAVDRRNVVMLAAILALQATIDLSLPQVSFSAHASGFVVGLVIGLALAMLDRRLTGRG